MGRTKAPHDTGGWGWALQPAEEAESERMIERKHGNWLQVHFPSFADRMMAVLRWIRTRM